MHVLEKRYKISHLNFHPGKPEKEEKNQKNCKLVLSLKTSVKSIGL